MLTSNFRFDFLSELSLMATTYLINVPTMTDPLLSSIFLAPKLITSVAISNLIYIITDLARASYNFGDKLLQVYIQSLTYISTIK